MQFLMLVYQNEKQWAELPEAQKNQMWRECHEYGEAITGSGHLQAGAPLEPTSTARTLRASGGKLMVTDGPFAETKEVLAGYHLVECRDMEEAMALGARFPGLKYGASLELRPIMKK